MKKNSGAAEEFMAIAGNHLSVVGLSMKQVTDTVKNELDEHSEYDKDMCSSYIIGRCTYW